MLLLDQGLPRTTTLHLRDSGLKAEPVGDVGLAADDMPSVGGGHQNRAPCPRPLNFNPFGVGGPRPSVGGKTGLPTKAFR
jgi:hypothetical protein